MMSEIAPPGAPESVPGKPVAIPIEPNVSQIVLGALFLGLGAWLAFSWLPSKRPAEPLEFAIAAVRDQAALLNRPLAPRVYQVLMVVAVLAMALGLGGIVSGLTWRNYVDTTCRRCRQRVIARRAFLGLKCPIGDYAHHAKFRIAGPVAVAVMGMLGLTALVGPNVWRATFTSETRTAEIQMNNFSGAIDQYKMDHKRWPDSLKALTKTDERTPEPYLQDVPNDPWGNAYEYRIEGKKYSIRSNGADGQPGTPDDIIWPKPKK